ncbi:MAG: hypothetical protein A2X49_05870 [Lentisphaerae bacterium GWF2_52_8]|nr:MAG: hypothetical protein A2X49_05870 [Lentisphaerae bacterium GWF2_52_8]
MGKVADISLRHHYAYRFCQAVTKHTRLGVNCVNFDLNEVRNRFSSGQKSLIKICHAGVLEFVAPVFSESRLCGCVFLGPFRCENPGGIPGAMFQKASKELPLPAKTCAKTLPKINNRELDDMINMVQLLANRLGTLIDSLNRGCLKGQEYSVRIPYFINREFKNKISITDLAEFLSLSVSRTSRLVKLNTGKSFPSLLAGRRLEHAKFLLENSSFNMEMISRHCGFSDSAYFFKMFKDSQKTTPSEYRRKLKRKIPLLLA